MCVYMYLRYISLLDLYIYIGFPGGTSVCQCKRHKRHRFHPWVRKIPALEEGMAAHSSIHAWRILWTEEPGGL